MNVLETPVSGATPAQPTKCFDMSGVYPAVIEFRKATSLIQCFRAGKTSEKVAYFL